MTIAMEEIDDPIAAYNDFLRATLVNENHAERILEDIAEALEMNVWKDRLYAVAQCLAIADWPIAKKIPPVLLNEYQRHELRDTIELLRMATSNIVGEKIEGHAELIAGIDGMCRKCNVVLNRAKNG